MREPGRWKLRRGELTLGGRTLIMGIINVTPDSFSDGGLFTDPSQAVEQGLALMEAGADILDVGGESTRPGSDPVSAEDEARRALPVVEALAKAGGTVSIDTMKAAVARDALAAGAQIINDVTALRADPAMAPLAAESGAAVVLMHMRGEPKTMQANPHYDDVVAEVRDFLAQRAAAAQAAGVDPAKIALDPGIGFGKNLTHNLLLIRHLSRLRELGHPVLLAASRKAFIGQLTGRQAPERLLGTVAAHVLGAALGADIVRVHDVAEVAEALAVADAIINAGGEA